MMVLRIETANPLRGGHRKARGLHETARLPKPERARRLQPRTSKEQALGRSDVHWSGGVMTIAIARPGIGTSEARLDPNRYGLRTVSAAGGSAATVAVRLTVRPVILLVMDDAGTPPQLWTHLPGRP